jgi:nickel-type superoxide dismutase maturation protease
VFRERYHGKRGVTPAVALAISAGVVLWRLRPFRVAVEGWSMAPALLPGDFLVATTAGRVRPGTVVVIRRPGRPALEMVKRVADRTSGRPDGGRVEPGHVWVLGDRADASTDSRDFGPVSREDVVGVVRFRYWPPRRFGPVR